MDELFAKFMEILKISEDGEDIVIRAKKSEIQSFLPFLLGGLVNGEVLKFLDKTEHNGQFLNGGSNGKT